MTTNLLTGQVFCLRNWAMCRNSLQIKLSLPDAGGQRTVALSLDGTGGTEKIPGLLLICKPEMDGAGVLFLGPDGTQALPSFALTLETVGTPLRHLHLEYRMVAATDAFSQTATEAYSHLQYDHLVFTAHETGYSIDMEASDAAILAVDAAIDVADVPVVTREDWLGDLAANLQILSYYSTAQAVREEMAKLREVLRSGAELPEAELAAAVAASNATVARLMTQTQQELQAYRPALLEGTTRK